jgi:hypothetical protein
MRGLQCVLMHRALHSNVYDEQTLRKCNCMSSVHSLL